MDVSPEFIQQYIALKKRLAEILKESGDNRTPNQRAISAEKLLERGLINLDEVLK